MAIRKLRDGPQGIEFSFTPRVVETGADERSNPITSVVIDWSSTAAPIRSSGGVGWSTPTLKKLRQVLLATLAEHGQSVPAALNGSPVLGVDQEIIRREFYSACTEEKPETRQRTFRRVITNALERELIRQCDFEGTTFLWFKNAIEQPEAVVANFLRHGSVGGEPINGFGSTKGSA